MSLKSNLSEDSVLDITTFELDEDEVVYSNGLPHLPELIYNQVAVDPVNGCWNWIGPYHGSKPRVVIQDIWMNRYTWMAPHRYSYLIHFNHTLKHGVVIKQHCCNPYCCNPDHLIEVMYPSEDTTNIDPWEGSVMDSNGVEYSSKQVQLYITTGSTTRVRSNKEEVIRSWYDNYKFRGGRFYTQDGRRIKQFLETPNGYTGFVSGVPVFWNTYGGVKVRFKDKHHQYSLSIYAYKPKDNDTDYRGPTLVTGI